MRRFFKTGLDRLDGRGVRDVRGERRQWGVAYSIKLNGSDRRGMIFGAEMDRHGRCHTPGKGTPFPYRVPPTFCVTLEFQFKTRAVQASFSDKIWSV